MVGATGLGLGIHDRQMCVRFCTVIRRRLFVATKGSGDASFARWLDDLCRDAGHIYHFDS